MDWPTTVESLEREQDRLAVLGVNPWVSPGRLLRVGACSVVFGRSGRDAVGWAAAVVMEGEDIVATAAYSMPTLVPFEPGRLALREGPILQRVMRDVVRRPDVLLVAAAGRDHPRRAGLALHLGAVLDLPTVGVTEDPLLATGDEPAQAWSSRAPLERAGEVVAYRVRTRTGSKPIVAHAAWRTTAEVAAEVVLGSCALARWPEAMREARKLARELRAQRT